MSEYGYEFFTDSNGGESFFIHRGTGEVIPPVTHTVPQGTFFVTPEQQEENRRRHEAAERRQFKEDLRSYQRENHSSLGKDFYFLPTVETFDGISPEMVTRLIYLNTFLHLNSNRLMLTQRTPLSRDDLPKVLKVSRSTARRFWNMVSPKYVCEAESGLVVNDKVFKRGKLNNKEHLQLMKFYIDGVRTLYTATDTGKHNRLGDLFKLLPFVNIEWNLLCYPEYAAEKDLDKIKLLSMAEFCRLIGYDVAHLNDLVSTYRGITFNVRGRKELFCSMIYDGVHNSEAKTCINPNILYSGSEPEKVKVLGALCRETR